MISKLMLTGTIIKWDSQLNLKLSKYFNMTQSLYLDDFGENNFCQYKFSVERMWCQQNQSITDGLRDIRTDKLISMCSLICWPQKPPPPPLNCAQVTLDIPPWLTLYILFTATLPGVFMTVLPLRASDTSLHAAVTCYTTTCFVSPEICRYTAAAVCTL